MFSSPLVCTVLRQHCSSMPFSSLSLVWNVKRRRVNKKLNNEQLFILANAGYFPGKVYINIIFSSFLPFLPFTRCLFLMFYLNCQRAVSVAHTH